MERRSGPFRLNLTTAWRPWSVSSIPFQKHWAVCLCCFRHYRKNLNHWILCLSFCSQSLLSVDYRPPIGDWRAWQNVYVQCSFNCCRQFASIKSSHFRRLDGPLNTNVLNNWSTDITIISHLDSASGPAELFIYKTQLSSLSQHLTLFMLGYIQCESKIPSPAACGFLTFFTNGWELLMNFYTLIIRSYLR